MTVQKKTFETKAREWDDYEKLHTWLTENKERGFISCDPRRCPVAIYLSEKIGEGQVVVGGYYARLDDGVYYDNYILSKLLRLCVTNIDRSTQAREGLLTGTECLAILEQTKKDYDEGLV